jgi:hypothetical protein
VADTLALSETVTRLMARVLEEQVTLTEVQRREARKTLAETVAFAEALVTEVIRHQAISETVSLTEAQQRQVGRALQETLGLTETRFVQLARGVAETLSLSEVLARLFISATPAVAAVGFKARSVVTGFVSPARALGFVSPARALGFVSPEGPR